MAGEFRDGFMISSYIRSENAILMIAAIFQGLDKKLRWDIFWVGIIQVANYIFPFLATTYLIKTIGVSLFGKTEFATLIVLYFITITNYEFHVSGTRDISRIQHQPEKLSDLISTLLTTKLYLFSIASFLFVSILLIWPDRFYNWLFISSYLIVIGHLFYQPFIFQGLGKVRVLAILNFLAKGISTLLIFVIIKSAKNYELVNLNYSISYILIGLTSLVLAIHFFKIKFSLKKLMEVRQSLKVGFYIFLTNGLIAQLNLNLSAILLGLYMPSEVLGSYSATLKIVIALHVLVLLPLKQVFFPTLSFLWVHDRLDYFRKFKTYTLLLVVANLLVAAGILLFGPFIIKLFYGQYFSQMIYIIRMLAFLPLLAGLSSAYINDGLIVMGKDKLVFQIQFFSVIINVLLLMIGIPIFGLTGALIIRLAADTGTLVTGMVFYYKSSKKLQASLVR